MHHFSELDIWVIRWEIERLLLGLRIKSFQGDGKHFLIKFRGGFALYISLDFIDYRVHITKEDPSLYPLPPWRKEDPLKGYRLKDVKAPKGERVLYLLFSKGSPLTEKKSRILVIELTGKYTNLFLLDFHGKILDMAKSLSADKAKTRFLRVGMTYEPLPPRSLNLWKIEKPTDREYLMRHFKPFFKEWERSKKPWAEWLNGFLEKIKKGDGGIIYYTKRGIPIFYSPAPLSSLENNPKKTFETFSEAVENFYLYFPIEGKGGRGEKRRNALLERLKKEIERLKAESERAKENGEIILRHMQEIKRGIEEVLLEGKKIPLNPKLSIGQNAEHYFALHKRYKRGIKKLEEKLSFGVAGGKKEKEKVVVVTPKQAEEPYWIFVSPGGFKVYVGKNARGNEKITFKVAGPDDIFFHVKDSPGAHVILKTGGREPQKEDILFAATLALKYSKLARDGKGIVSYTKKKNIKKPSGAPKGLVLLKEEKTIQVRIFGEPVH